MNFRLKEEDLLEKGHSIVLYVFGILNENNFIKTLEWISKGYGFSYDYIGCSFPNNQDEYDIFTNGKLEGIEFWTHGGDSVLVDYNTFYYYLKKVCDDYVEEFPNDKEKISVLLTNFRDMFNIASE